MPFTNFQGTPNYIHNVNFVHAGPTSCLSIGMLEIGEDSVYGFSGGLGWLPC